MDAAQGIRSFLGGAALAGLVFFAFHRLDLACGGAAPVAALGIAALLAGWSIGAEVVPRFWRPRLAGQWLLLIAAVLVWGLWGWLRNTVGSSCGVALLAAVGMVPAGILFAAPARAHPGLRLALVAGAAGGFMALSAGLAAAIGDAWTMLALGGAAAAWALVVPAPQGSRRHVQERAPEGSNACHAGNLLLCAAMGAVCVALLRTYSYAAGWFAYAAADLALAFCVGLVLRVMLPDVGRVAESVSLLARVLGLLAIIVLLESSFLFYPYLIFSESAVCQSGRSLLQPQRMFPLWAFAAALAVLRPASGEGAAEGKRRASGSVAAAVGAAGVLLLPSDASHVWNYVLAGSLCVLALAPVGVNAMRQGGALPRRLALPGAVLALALAALAWTFLGEPNLRWRWLRRTFVWYLKDIPGRLNERPPRDRPKSDIGDVDIRSVQYDPWGLRAMAEARQETGRFFCGNMVSSNRGLDSGSVRLAVVLAVTGTRGNEGIGVVGPALDETDVGVKVLAPEARVIRIHSTALGAAAPIPGGLDAIICGPGPLTVARCPLSVVNLEVLSRLRTALKSEGVLVLWLPTRALTGKELMRVLATVIAVFPRTRTFLYGDEVVLLCGEKPRVNYKRLRSLFLEPRRRVYLGQGGFWDARQVIACYTAAPEHLLKLCAGARPYRRDSPSRAPVLARDLAEQSRAEVLALLVQYRLEVRDHLDDSLEFSSAKEKALALRKLRGFHVAQTDTLLHQIGRVARVSGSPGQGVRELSDVLESPAVDLELFAPDVESRRLKLAIALMQFGLPQESLALLRAEARPEEDTFAVWYWRGRSLEALGRGEDALVAYEAALAEEPDSVEVMLRLARIHLAGGEAKNAARRLHEVLEHDPRNVEALVRLSYLYGRAERYEEAARLAEKALQIAPENRAARDQFYLYSQRTRPDANPDGRE